MEKGEIDQEVNELFEKHRMVVASNRVPYSIVKTHEGVNYKKESGGLVNALDPILKKSHGLWVGWNGMSGPMQGKFPEHIRVSESNEEQYHLRFVPLGRDEVSRYYHGFSNRVLWPNFHNFPGKCHMDRSQWNYYIRVNNKFSDIIFEETRGRDDIVWVHDYHLTMVPKFLRKLDRKLKIFFFLHTPFPHHDIFRIIPWCRQILRGMLGSDEIGFHIEDYAMNFLSCAENILGLHVDYDKGMIRFDHRDVQVCAHPISIDYDEFETLGKSTAVKRHMERLRRGIGNKKLILGVDRLDYTKGIKERLYAIERFLEKYREMRRRILFVQIAVPSRSRVEEYRSFKREVDEIVGRINGRFTVENWSPIRYIYGSLPREELVALYRLADVALITPCKDGMNLVAKEYVASQGENCGVLVLSEFTGAALELEDALMVNPYDVDAVADNINRALTMHPEEKRMRCNRQQDVVKKNNIYKWVSDYFKHSLPVNKAAPINI